MENKDSSKHSSSTKDSLKSNSSIKDSSKNSSTLLIIMLIIIIVLYGVNLFYINNLSKGSPSTSKVEMIHLFDTNCTDCVDLKPFFEQFSQLGINLETKNVDISSSQGKKLITKYKIEAVPTIIFSKEISTNAQIAQVWEQVGTIEEDGSYVMRELTPPYKELDTGNVRGLVNVTYLSDTNCKECYDVMFHKDILTQMGIKITSEKTIDYFEMMASSDDSKNLIEKYNITKIPTVIISKEAEVYASVKKAWELVGTQEEDGVFIFRSIELLGDKVYHNLETGLIISGKTE